MKRDHCDLCDAVVKAPVQPIVEYFIAKSEQDIPLETIRLCVNVESIISIKRELEPTRDIYNLPSIPEMQHIEDGYILCSDCWQKILSVIGISNYNLELI